MAVLPLSVNGNKVLVGGKPESLAGNSLFWSNSDWGGHRFYKEQVVSWLKHDWNSRVVRAAIAVDVPGGYLSEPEANMASLTVVVDAAITHDMYVIIDWHTHFAERHIEAAIEFFGKVATKYKNFKNIIYEIYNEPENVSWDEVIKPYAVEVITGIRRIDRNNVIVVGTPCWSQDVGAASLNPISSFTNIAYALHFYAASHKEWLRKKAIEAMGRGVALFVTEWGAVSKDGDGTPDLDETVKWMRFMKVHDISHVNWSVNDKDEGASILKQGSAGKRSWNNGDLSESGHLVKGIIESW